MKNRRKRLAVSAFALTLLMTVAGATVAPAAQAAVVVGVCTIKANLPHGSTHVNGTINGTGTVSCSIVMDEIYLRVKLEKSTGQVITGTTDDYFNSSWESGNASTSCSNSGTWRIRSEYALRAPAGYNPSYAAGSTISAWAPVVCGVSRKTADGSGEPEPYVETTVTIMANEPIAG